MRIRTQLATLAAAGAMVAGSALPAAAQPVDQDGLVNVNLGDVTAQLPIGVAANVCDTNINVLARQLSGGDVTCDAVAEPSATWPRNRQGNGPVNQQGLVNVNVGDVTVQAPIGIAANVCGTSANVLAQQARIGDAECEAITEPVAEIT